MSEERHHEQSSHFDATQAKPGSLAVCPVMEGTPVDKEEAEKYGRVKEYQGKKYYLCCDPCITMFEISPEKYAK